MANFNPTVLTAKGNALDAKVQAGRTRMHFTKVATSDTQYSQAQINGLTQLGGVKQETLVAEVKVVNRVSVEVSAAFTNSLLQTGYYVWAIGLYAQDPDEGEILYSVTVAESADYMPAFNGLSSSSILVRLTNTLTSSDSVDLTVNPAATATVQQINDLKADINDVRAYIGYNQEDIVGVEVDMETDTFTRLAGAVGKEPGDDFNVYNMFGGRRRCNLSDAGVVNAYYGDAGYKVDGSNGQVMVEQPKFYYKFVPLKLFKVDDLEGWACSKFRLYLSDMYRPGFKIHPNFTRGVPALMKDKIYTAAYKGSIFDVSDNSYKMNDEQIADFAATSGDKLCSISGAKPCSGATQNLTRANTRRLAQNRGTGWGITDFLSNSATQMLLLVEYASFDSQTVIGQGVVNITDDGSTNMSIPSGGTNSLGNKSGNAPGTDGLVSVSYRGEENFWGNIWSWEDGLNIEAKGLHNAYFALGNFVDDSKASPYKSVGFQLAKANGYVNAIGWSEQCDFAFLAMRVTGASNMPINDYFWQNATYNGFMVSMLGAGWSNGLAAGAFYRHVDDVASSRDRNLGGRVLFVPAGGQPVE